ncbi:MAG TPA: type II secretion system minor pseudopilin GspK [Sphingomonas sp.]
MLLVAVVAVMAGAGLERLRLATRLAGNAAAAGQARSFARAAEVLATTRIDALLERNPSRVTLAGGWSNRPFGLPLPGGQAVARVSDGGNCFNLNGLVTAVSPGVYTSDTPARLQFARLMRSLQVPAQVAEQVAAGAADWIDTDGDRQPGGAEDASYLGLQPGYRTAGTLMADVSELRAVAGVTPTLYATLRPWICTLPVAAPALINVNTISPEQAPLLAMLLPDGSPTGGIGTALLRRSPQGYADAGAFWTAAAFGVGAALPGGAQTAVKTNWFALRVDVTQGEASLTQISLVDATQLPSRLVSRQWGEP